MSINTLAKRRIAPAKEGLVEKFYLFLRNHALLVLTLLTLSLIVVYINPFHETAISDDWAYILTSRHLYYTGQYNLHDWSSANIMFQAYWGALFTLVGGFSIGTLHISTLVLLVIGIFSLYLLAQEHGLDRRMAGVLSFCLVGNPLVIFLMLTFMTDVPALALLIAGLLLYTRGLKRQSLSYMLAAGLVTVGATFIRPTALALLLGLGVIFWLDKARLNRWKLYLAGSIFPFLGGLFLVFGGTSATFNNGAPNSSGQIQYMTHLDVFLPNVFLWRPDTFLIYLGFFSAPLVLGAIVGLLSGKSKRLKLNPKVVAGFSLLVLGALCYNIFVLKGDWTLPYIGFNLEALTSLPLLGGLATIIAVPGGIIIGVITWERVGSLAHWRAIPLEQRFLDTVSVFMLLYHLVFFGVAERYLFVLLPFTFIVMGRYIQPLFGKLYHLIIVSSFVVVIITAMITRFFQAEQAAEWEASNYTLTLGATPLKVFGPWGWYSSYNYADYKSHNPNKANNGYISDVWLPQRKSEANYLITNYKEELTENGWQVIKTISYSDPLFQNRLVYVLKRVGI